MKIKKAVITAAGLGTRVLPASKAMPKEMINIVDKPSIQYIVEECVNSGITDILIILSRGKHVIEDHFDRSPDLENKLISTGNKTALDEIIRINEMANITYVRQPSPKGLGDAVLCAKNYINNEPFAVLYGDDVIFGDSPVIGQLCDAYEKYNKNIVGMQLVSDEMILKCASLEVSNIESNCYNITNMIEKPDKDHVLSNYAILGRCILEPDIFSILEKIPVGRNNELQLTDAMLIKALDNKMIGVDFKGHRYDMGNKLEIIKANIDIALSRPDLGPDIRDYIKSLL